MKNRIKINVAIFLLLLISSMPLFASNTNWGTSNTIKTDNDKILDLNHFREVNFDKVFAYTSLNLDFFNLGGATKFNNIFLSGYYSGNFWGNIEFNKTENNYPTYNSSFTDGYTSQYHNINVLLGLQNMGFLLNTTIYYWNNHENNEQSKPLSENSTLSEEGEYSVGLTWGGYSINKEKFIIKPTVELKFDFYNIKEKSVETKDNLITTKNIFTNTDPILTATLGLDFETGHNSKFYQEFGGDYLFIAGIYPDKNVATVTTLDTTTNKSIETNYHRTGKLDLKNKLFPRYRCEYRLNDKFTIGGRANVGIHFDYSDSGITTPNLYDTSKKDENSKAFEFTLAADFGIGVKYMLKPNFAITAGYTGTIPYFSTKTTTTTYKETTSTNTDIEKKSISVTTGNYENSLNSGFTWNINKNCILDFGADIFVKFGKYEKTSIRQILKTSLFAGFTYRK